MLDVALTVVGLLLLAVAVYALLLWNALVRLRNEVDRAWANVDVVLKQRADEVPNLVATVSGYAAHERALLDATTRARADLLAARGPAAKAAANDQLAGDLARVFAVAEAYPDLKAASGFLALQKRLSGLEDLLADRREMYNETVATFNTRIQEIPDVLVARRMRLSPREYFKAEGSDREVPVARAA